MRRIDHNTYKSWPFFQVFPEFPLSLCLDHHTEDNSPFQRHIFHQQLPNCHSILHNHHNIRLIRNHQFDLGASFGASTLTTSAGFSALERIVIPLRLSARFGPFGAGDGRHGRISPLCFTILSGSSI